MIAQFRSMLGPLCLCLVIGTTAEQAQAQWGYPGGYGGWGGWGATTVQGDMARGMGEFARELGFYNKQTAVANAINAGTVMRFNEYLFQSQMEANRRMQRRREAAQEQNLKLRNQIRERLRDNPSPGDVNRGDALNAALDEINNPKVYVRALEAADAKINGDQIRLIPFRYASAAVTISIHQLATGELPAPLQRPEFAGDRATLKALDAELDAATADETVPDPETADKLLDTIYAMEEKAASVLMPGSLDQKQAERYLMALHGLVVMLKSPKLDPYLAGVETRPDVTLGELLRFMTAFNLRFGIAETAQQRRVYANLFPMLDTLRDQVSTVDLANASPVKPKGNEAQEFFSGMTFDDLQKVAPKPQPRP
jgi:hypothetical protein